MQTVLTCLNDLHDRQLLGLAVAVCLSGIYGTFAIARHAARSQEPSRRNWALVAIGAAGATAWATHMIALLAFRPGMESAFDPILMVASLMAAMAGIAIGIWMVIGRRDQRGRFLGGLVIGASVVVLHYLGQASYLVRGTVTFDPVVVVVSSVLGLILFGVAIVLSGERSRGVRPVAPLVLILGIAVLHVGGMVSMQIAFDPRVTFPRHALTPQVVAPIVAAVSFALVVLAVLGLRLSLSAAAGLRQDRQRLRELANLAVEGLAICDDGIVVTVNDSLERLSGLPREEIVGRPFSQLVRGVCLEDLPNREEREGELSGAEGTKVPVRLLRSEVRLGTKCQTVVAFRDQRERLRTEARIRNLAFTDALTGLSNRSRFSDVLDERLEAAASEDRAFAVFHVDLDRFKWVNDTLGHAVGDELLRRVGGRLKRACRDGADFASRLGGDEFALIAQGDGERASSLAADVVELVGRPYVINGQAIDISASVGITLVPEDGSGAEVLNRNADLALYCAKGEGGGVYRFFDPQMEARAQKRRALELDLRRAVVLQEFVVHYQPQVDPKTGVFQGAEALVRWLHPQRGMVPPDSFIPLAEEIGLIGAIGDWVLRTACEEARGWSQDLSVAVNLSSMQLRDRNLFASVAAILRDSGLEPHRLELELTESAILQDDATTYENLGALQAMGIRISMDDFGTGYSSLSYLRRFPFDKLKIDRSFVQQIPDDTDSIAIVRAITTLGAELGMKVTIEGVETEDQQAFAAANGCHQVQGYLISRPVEARQLRRMFEEQASTGAVLCRA